MPKKKLNDHYVEVTYSNSAKVNTGNYEQEAPMFSAKSVIPFAEGVENTEFLRLKGIVDPLLAEKVKMVKLDLSGLRIRVKDGKRYISVTSVMNHDKDLSKVKNIEEYGIRGTEIDRLIGEFVKTGIWETPKAPLKALSYDEILYKEFFEGYKERMDFTNSKTHYEVFHDGHLYSGEIDMLLKVDGQWALVDFKTGSWNWAQLVAYWKCLEKPTSLCCVFDLKKGKIEVLDMSKPETWQKHWENFLIRRGEVSARFGV